MLFLGYIPGVGSGKVRRRKIRFLGNVSRKNCFEQFFNKSTDFPLGF